MKFVVKKLGNFRNDPTSEGNAYEYYQLGEYAKALSLCTC